MSAPGGEERPLPDPDHVVLTDSDPSDAATPDGTDPVTGTPAAEADQAAGAAGEAQDVADAVDAAAVEQPLGDAAEAPDELGAAYAERDSYLDALRHLQADFENYKKRMVKQQTDQVERAVGSLIDKLLPVLDTADLAVAHGGGEAIDQLRGALLGSLEKEGLQRIATEGAPFDPNVHDAVAHEPAESAGGGQEVAEVFRAGYLWKGRVLRPAMVKVRG